MTAMEVTYMDNFKTTQELLASKGLTAEQSLHILDSIELNVDKILDDILELREQLWNIEYTDESCDKYYEEDVYTAYNCIANRIKRSVKNIDVIIRSAKEDMRDDT